MRIDNGLTIGLLTPKSLDSKADGLRLLEILSCQGAQFCPEFYGNFEPLRTPFDLHNPASALEAWEYPFLWKRRKSVKSDGSVWMANRGCHGAIYINAQEKGVNWSQVFEFMRTCVATFGCDFGYAHLTSEAELGDSSVPYETLHPIRIGVTTHDLRKGIPLLCWMTILGAPYLDLMGRDCLRRTSLGVVEAYPDDSVCIRLSENPTDMRTDYAKITRVRKALMEQLGSAFFLETRTEVTSTIVPTFRMGTSQAL